MRISKDPEVRRQEIIDTAMRLFAEKGYEATTMSDIAKAVGVVPGLCYKYFASKHELYHTAVSSYAKECIQPDLVIFNKEEESLKAYANQLIDHFVSSEGTEKYHDFFHKPGNEMFNTQMSIMLCEYMIPHMEKFLEKLYAKGLIEQGNFKSIAKFISYGQIPIMNDDQLSPREKAEQIYDLIKRLLS